MRPLRLADCGLKRMAKSMATRPTLDGSGTGEANEVAQPKEPSISPHQSPNNAKSVGLTSWSPFKSPAYRPTETDDTSQFETSFCKSSMLIVRSSFVSAKNFP